MKMSKICAWRFCETKASSSSNAIKFTSFGEIRLDVDEIVVVNKKSRTLKFSVKDTGVGKIR
jgi:hypothetical protein